MNELIMPHNAGVKRVLESMKEVLIVFDDLCLDVIQLTVNLQSIWLCTLLFVTL